MPRSAFLRSIIVATALALDLTHAKDKHAIGELGGSVRKLTIDGRQSASTLSFVK